MHAEDLGLDKLDLHRLGAEGIIRADGSSFEFPGTAFGKLSSIGWIADSSMVADYPSGKVPLACLDRLRDDLAHSQPFGGFAKYSCKICRLEQERTTLSPSSGNAPGLIWVPGADGVYVAPANLVHLVYDHEYQPPDGFIVAVAEAPRVGSLAFADAIRDSIDNRLYQALRQAWEQSASRGHDPSRALCRYCDTPLRTERARQCLCCGLDWHDRADIKLRGRKVRADHVLALFD